MLYFFRHAFIHFFNVLFVLCLITTLSEIIEYSKQSANIEKGGFLLSAQMAFLHLPYMIHLEMVIQEDSFCILMVQLFLHLMAARAIQSMKLFLTLKVDGMEQ